MTTSKPLYVYLQRPDTGDWVTVGRYRHDPSSGVGHFNYAPSYIDAGHPWSIDPVNAPLQKHGAISATRYGGLHDVLRDACPDAWGRLLIQRKRGLSENAPHYSYLLYAGNEDRWGALAVGTTTKPSVSGLGSARVPDLAKLAEELRAMQERRPPVDRALRNRIMATPSMGGARPKATVQDGDDFWVVKPILASDTEDIPLLEHVTQEWGRAVGMRFAKTEHIAADSDSPLSVMRSLRFDRKGGQRLMALSAASLLQTEYPGHAGQAAWSYPLLAKALRLVGAPQEDATELFCRMVFNAVIGNDDDHPRNHAIHYVQAEKCWRLAPAFDVVPNPDFTPTHLSMQLCMGAREITRENILRDAKSFGLSSREEATDLLGELLDRIERRFDEVEPLLGNRLRPLMATRLSDNARRLRPIRRVVLKPT